MLPDFVREGFHQDDYAPLPKLQTHDPKPGQHVKINVTFNRPLTSDEGDEVTWALFGGRVVEVQRPDRIVAVVEVTTLPDAPELFTDSGMWRIVLELDEDYEHPWLLVDMRAWEPS